MEAVVTQPDRPRGRGQRVSASPVKEVAAEAGVRIYQPESMKSDEARDFFAEIKPDAVVIIAYGQIIPRRLLDIPRLGWMNLHASLLPKYRGAAPIAWAIINGESKTGLTTMRLDPGLDTGPILMQREIEIGSDETAPELAEAHGGIGRAPGCGLADQTRARGDHADSAGFHAGYLCADPYERARAHRLVANGRRDL